MRLIVLAFFFCFAITQSLLRMETFKGKEQNQSPVQSENSYSQDQQSFFQTPIFIGLAALFSFNVLVFCLVYGIKLCLRRRFNINTQIRRQKWGQRYPHLTFQTKSHCLTEGQTFKSNQCYQFEDVICNLPAFVYGRQVQAESSHLNYFTIKQCQKCGGMTRTLQIFKYGRLQQFWQTIFMILISPCFLAFTIRLLTSNSVLWRKFFCVECGYQKTQIH